MPMQFLEDQISWLNRMMVSQAGRIKALEVEIQELKKQIKTADSICLEDPEPCVAAKLERLETRIKETEVVSCAAASKKDKLEFLVQHWIEEHGYKHEVDNIVRINMESRIEDNVNKLWDELKITQARVESLTKYLQQRSKKESSNS